MCVHTLNNVIKSLAYLEIPNEIYELLTVNIIDYKYYI